MYICSEVLTKSIVQLRHFFVKKFCTGIAGISGFHHIKCQNFSALTPLFLFLKLCVPNE